MIIIAITGVCTDVLFFYVCVCCFCNVSLNYMNLSCLLMLHVVISVFSCLFYLCSLLVFCCWSTSLWLHLSNWIIMYLSLCIRWTALTPHSSQCWHVGRKQCWYSGKCVDADTLLLHHRFLMLIFVIFTLNLDCVLCWCWLDSLCSYLHCTLCSYLHCPRAWHFINCHIY